MSNIYKIITFLVIGSIISFASCELQSTFVIKFSENILPLLTTLFAINIASSTLIASKLREIQDKTNFEFTSTKKNLKTSFYEQIFLIGLAFIFGIIRESNLLHLHFTKETIYCISDAIIFFSFIYYLDIIRDIGLALFDLLNFNDKNQ